MNNQEQSQEQQVQYTHYVIDIDTANNVLAYLANMPIREALGLFNAFKNGKAIVVNETKEVADTSAA